METLILDRWTKFEKKTFVVGGTDPRGVIRSHAHLYIPRRCTCRDEASTVGRSKPPRRTKKRMLLSSENEFLALGGPVPSPARSVTQMPTSVHTLGPYTKQRHRDPIQLSLPETCGLAEKIGPFSTKFPTKRGTVPPQNEIPKSVTVDRSSPH
jgi:hypothetical protein